MIETRQTVTITCDNGGPDQACPYCKPLKFEGTIIDARVEARKQGWYAGVGDTVYCPTRTEELGIRVRKGRKARS